jgi:tRNA A-37 threonylcarbamoyl transferase component Bud32
MQSAAQIAPPGPLNPEPAGGVLRCGGYTPGPSGSQTHARIADDVAQQAARRIGTIAILTAATVVGHAILQHALQPEMGAAEQTPLFRLSALFLVLAGVGLAVLQRAELVSPQDLLDLALVFEIAGAFALALMENAAGWPDAPIRGATIVAAWIAICVAAIPNQPWKSITAASVSAAAVPCAHLIAAQVLGYPALSWNRLAAYTLSPFFVVAWTPFISTRLHRMHEDLVRSREFGSYHLDRLLGQGGMGEVWHASHRFLRRDAAVKLVRAGALERTGSSGQRLLQKRFETEAQAIASLQSPHTVAIYDFGLAENGTLYYAMEYLHGLDAESLVEEYGPLPAGRVISFLMQACESLEEAHDAGLVHRDVKPSNLFICRLGKRTDFVKVLDFGLVKEVAEQTQTALTTTGTSGTPAFMSPEQARGEEVDARADIYGLGCLAYFLLTGAVVFKRPNAMAMAMAHVTERPEPPSTRSELPIPDSLERVVMACLEKNRADRPQSVAELRAMLDACTEVAPWTEGDANQWWALHQPEPLRKAS